MIPEMTDPLGKHWHQPQDIRDAPMDDKIVLLTPRQFEELPEYSRSMPTGVYEGKCWKRFEPEVAYKRNPDGSAPPNKPEAWYLGWFGPHKNPKLVSNNWRKIEVVT